MPNVMAALPNTGSALCSTPQSLCKQGDIKELEKIQKRATKLVINFKKIPYKDRLMHLKLPTLKYRRLRGDMIEVFKIMPNLYDPEVVLARYGPKGKRYDTIDIPQNIAIRYDTMHKRNVKFNALQHGGQFVNVCCCCSGCERGR